MLCAGAKLTNNWAHYSTFHRSIGGFGARCPLPYQRLAPKRTDAPIVFGRREISVAEPDHGMHA